MALKFLRKPLKRNGHTLEIGTDRLRSYGIALGEIGLRDRRKAGRWKNNRSENIHQPFVGQEQAMLRFRRMRTLKKFAAVHTSVYNLFNTERSLSSRSISKLNSVVALAEGRGPRVV